MIDFYQRPCASRCAQDADARILRDSQAVGTHKRDYSLLGEDAQRAVQNCLAAAAEGYQPTFPARASSARTSPPLGRDPWRIRGSPQMHLMMWYSKPLKYRKERV